MLFFIWQIWNVFNVHNKYLTDKNEFVLVSMLSVLAIILVLHVIKQFKMYLKYNDTYNAINSEIDSLIQNVASVRKENLIDVKSELAELSLQKNHIDKDLYLKQLILLKAKLEF